MEITRIGTQSSTKGPGDWFTGVVRIDPLFQFNESRRAAGAVVTFEPGARTVWHTHPLGQTLIVTAGVGWIQKEGSTVQVIRAGDIITIDPCEGHWHGATRETVMTHIAIHEMVNGSVANWMEEVSDEEYNIK